MNNIWFDLNGYTIADSIGRKDYVQAYLQDAANGNTEEDPQLKGISRVQDGNLDPRPGEDGPAYQNLKDYPDDEFFEGVDYKGAFGLTNWANDPWTALTHYGAITGIEEVTFNPVVPGDFKLSQNYPNPFNPVTTINFELPNTANVNLTVYNMLGQKVATLVSGHKAAGSYSVKWNAENLSSGMYLYRLEFDNKVLSRKMLLLK